MPASHLPKRLGTTLLLFKNRACEAINCELKFRTAFLLIFYLTSQEILSTNDFEFTAPVVVK
jgi:hypothetical protein